MTTPPTSEARTSRDVSFTEFVLMCAALMAMNALSIDPMLPAFPQIAQDLAIPHANDRQLIISIYFMGLGVGSLLFGVLSDRFGRKRVLGVSLILFVGATIACASAASFAWLLAARALAGFFAGASRVIVVGIVRDRFQGDAMARVMSLIFTVFMIIPVLAPSFGQAILLIAPWRWIFWILAILASGVIVWMMLRLPETLNPENRLPISASAIGRMARQIVTTRTTIGYMVASGVMMSCIIAFIVSVQQIIYDIFDSASIFGIAFGVMAGCMGLGGLLNSRLVSRFGARRLSQGALIGLVLISIVHLAVIWARAESLVTFMVLQSLTMLATAFTSANFSSISMEPFAKGAGIASSFQAFLTTLISSLLGAMVGAAFNGTTLPLVYGQLCFGGGALLVVFWAESGRLFTRPHHDALRKVEP